jgi:4-amino-4-deoxy-L-arabinose transferase-like glycosyltransferase
VGIAVIACAAVLARWWGGPTPAWGRLHWRFGVPLFLAMIAPWYVVVGVISQGEFFRFALGKQIAERMLTGMEQHGGIPGYYILTSLVTFHPWSALLPAALFAAWGRRRELPEFAFLLGWVVGPLILLECVQTKLVHYYLPAYPACALLTAWLVVGLMREEVNIRRWPLGRLGLGLLGGVGIGISAVFAAGTIVLPSILRWPCLVIAVIVATGTLWGMLELQRGATARATFGLAGTWGLAIVTISAWLLPNAEPYRTPRLVGECLARLCDRHHVAPVLLSYQEPSVVYAMGRPAPLIRTWEQFYDQLDRHRAVVSALIPIELAEFLRRDHLEVSILETIEGFNLNKGQSQLLRFAVIRRKDPSDTTRPDAVASNEKLLVK